MSCSGTKQNLIKIKKRVYDSQWKLRGQKYSTYTGCSKHCSLTSRSRASGKRSFDFFFAVIWGRRLEIIGSEETNKKCMMPSFAVSSSLQLWDVLSSWFSYQYRWLIAYRSEVGTNANLRIWWPLKSSLLWRKGVSQFQREPRFRHKFIFLGLMRK